MSEVQFRIRKFNGTDFGVWKAQMEALFDLHKLTTAIKKDITEIPADKHPEFKEANIKASANILLSLDDKHPKLVKKMKDAKSM